MKQKRKRMLVGFLIGIFAIFFFYNYFFNLNLKNLEPPTGLITGKAVYNEALTLEQLKEGVELSGGWNVFRWTDELEEPISAYDGLKSLADYYYYAYDYSDMSFYFNPNQKLADYKDKGYYTNRTFDKLEPGKRYAVYMIKNKVKLQYEIPEIEVKEEIELKEEKSFLNDFGFWIILIIILIFIFYKKRKGKS